MISIIISSRVEGNKNHNLIALLESLRVNTLYPSLIEVLVKYDFCDQEARFVHDSLLPDNKYPFKIKQIYEEKLRGYIDIHYGYNLLIPLLSPSSKIVISMADDFTVNHGWDFALCNQAQTAGDYFIIHQRPHPPISRPDYNINPFDVSFNPFHAEDLHIIDEAPAWSTKLINDVETFPISFTDAWTLCIERVLWFKYDINITRFTDGIFVNRKTGSMDQEDHPRWNTDRKENFEYMKTELFKEIIESQCKNIVERLS